MLIFWIFGAITPIIFLMPGLRIDSRSGSATVHSFAQIGNVSVEGEKHELGKDEEPMFSRHMVRADSVVSI